MKRFLKEVASSAIAISAGTFCLAVDCVIWSISAGCYAAIYLIMTMQKVIL